MNSTTTQPIMHQYAMVIPCNNEEKKLPFNNFLQFAQKHPEVLLCFVIEESRNKTIYAIKDMQTDSPQNICMHLLNNKADKVEAVRQGMIYISKNSSAPLLGYLDTNLSTKPEEWLEMAKHKEQYPNFGAIVGRRIQRFDENINTFNSSSLFSKIIKKFIRKILKSPFQNIYRSAKIFDRNLVPFLFNQPFMASWLIDLEIFLRLQKKFGSTSLQKGILEFPLVQWNSKFDYTLKPKQIIKMPIQLLKLHYQYNIGKKNKANNKYATFNKKTSLLMSLAKHLQFDEIYLQKHSTL